MYQTIVFEGKSRFAILGLLSIRPMSGYDIRKTVQESLAHFWRESYGSIYPLLRRLESEGLVVRVEEKGSRAARRYVYSLTPPGTEALQAWLVRPPEEEPPIRSELLLKHFFGNLLPAGHLESHLAAFRDQQHQLIEQLRAVDATVRNDRSDEEGSFYWLLTLRRGILIAEARRQWADETLIELAARKRRKRPAARSRMAAKSAGR